MKRLLFLGCLPLVFFNFSACAQEKIAGDLSAEEAQQYIQEQDPVILDVRTDREYNQGHLPDARLLNFYKDDFKKGLEELPKEESYLVYCHSGARSAKAVKMMEELGFKEVSELSGGVASWNKEGQKLEKE